MGDTNLNSDLTSGDGALSGTDMNVYVRNDPAGTLTYHVSSNGGIEYELPYYDINLFRFCSNNDYGYTVANTFGQGQLGYVTFGTNKYSVTSVVKNISGATYSYIYDQSTAEDFTLLRFQAAPFFSVY